MSSRVFVAHDRAISAARMYIQMAVVGLVLATLIYGISISALLANYVSGPIPERIFENGMVRFTIKPGAKRLRIISLAKYFVSFNLKNYFNLQLSTVQTTTSRKSEIVETELQPLVQRREIPRETYRKVIYLITNGRVEQLRLIFPLSLLFFPIFSNKYISALRSCGKTISGSMIPTSRTDARICLYFCVTLTPGFSCRSGRILPIGTFRPCGSNPILTSFAMSNPRSPPEWEFSRRGTPAAFPVARP